MYFPFSSVLALSTLVVQIRAGSSFGGANHYFLAALDSAAQNHIIDSLISANARVIRTFVRPEVYDYEKGNFKMMWPDVESSMGSFVDPLISILDHYDDMLYAVYFRSGGKLKVILSLHDANMIAGYTDPCDAYCTYMSSRDMAWQSFYTDRAIRNAFKNRLTAILVSYKSKNFGGRPWRDLNEVILAIDLENEPGVAHGNYPLGGWICDISTHLKNSVGLKSIGVATGAIGGSNGGDASSGPNWPDEIFQCGAIDIISIHGYFNKVSGGNAGTTWCSLFAPDGPLVSKARQYGKLLMAEEWVYNGGPGSKTEDIYDQGHALNALGIPWSYWDVMSGDETCKACGNNEVSVDRSAFTTLKTVMSEAYTSVSAFDWSRFLPNNSGAVSILDGTCGRGNGGTCTWGCQGWNCNSKTPCQGDLECTGGTCQACTWGCLGWNCSVDSPCKDSNECVNGICKPCSWGCLGWSCSASQPCSGQKECINGVCKDCTWGCLGWNCSNSSPCKKIHQCENAVCKPCNWGCLGWNCDAKTPCKAGFTCVTGVCKDDN